MTQDTAQCPTITAVTSVSECPTSRALLVHLDKRWPALATWREKPLRTIAVFYHCSVKSPDKLYTYLICYQCAKTGIMITDVRLCMEDQLRTNLQLLFFFYLCPGVPTQNSVTKYTRVLPSHWCTFDVPSPLSKPHKDDFKAKVTDVILWTDT